MFRLIRVHGGGLNESAVRTEVPVQDSQRGPASDRGIDTAADIFVVDFVVIVLLQDSVPVDREALLVQQGLELLQQSPETSRIVEVLHQVLARRTDISQ